MIRTAERKLYDLYDGDKYIGRYDVHGICDITGASTKHVYRASGGALAYKKRYTIQDAGCEAVRILHKEPIKNFPAEWAKVTEEIRDVISAEKRIREVWDKTVRPFRRRNNSIWRF